MPVVLSQIFEPGDRVYKDAEGALYHYPRIYFGRVRPGDSFIHYRPIETELGDERTLVEAKSLNDLRDAVNRMRYGMGQLLDYTVRYRSELQGAKPLLAFGRPPDRETSFIATILDENGVAFASQDDNALIPLNDRARSMMLFR